MQITNVRNLAYTEAGAINCEVLVGVDWLPFCATADDSMAYGAKLFDEAVNGVWGEIAPYLHSVQAADDEASIAATKAALMANVEALIAPLARAVKYGIATEDEAERLEALERYTVFLNRVDPENPVWPEQP